MKRSEQDPGTALGVVVPNRRMLEHSGRRTDLTNTHNMLSSFKCDAIQGVCEECECDWSRVSKARGLKEDAIERLPPGRRPPLKLCQRPDDVLSQGATHAAHTAVRQRH